MPKTGGTKSKKFWTFVRRAKKPNIEDLLAIKKEDGTRLFLEKDIKEYTENYYTNLYSSSTSELFSPEWTKLIEEEVKLFHSVNIMNSHPINAPITLEETLNAIKAGSLGKSAGPSTIKYEFLKYGGDCMANSLHTMFQKIFDSETLPDQWLQSNIINLGKGKGDREKLSSKRGITLSECPAKVFERILLSRISNILPFSEAQAGGRHKRGCADQLFILKSIINQRKYEGKPSFIAFPTDIEVKFWDQILTVRFPYPSVDRIILGTV